MIYREIISILHGISNSDIMSKKIPMKIKLPILSNIDKLSKELKNWTQSCNELLRRYANKDPDGNPIVVDYHYDIPDDLLGDYNKEFNDILNCETNLSRKNLQKIPVESFDEYDESKFDVLTLNEIQLLQFMIDM